MSKLILNSAFGKICDSLRRSHCDVLTDPKECAEIIADLNFTLFAIIDSNLVVLQRIKKYNFKKIISAGSVILEISKKYLLQFYYNVCKLQSLGEGQNSSLS